MSYFGNFLEIRLGDDFVHRPDKFGQGNKKLSEIYYSFV